MSYGPKILHEWQFAGYCVRIAEDEPGIVHFEQAKCEGELWEWKFERTEKPMGDANEIIQLSLALRDVEAERDEARLELAEAEEAILAVRERVLQTKAGEPREAIWSLLKFFAGWDAAAPAVRRALGRK